MSGLFAIPISGLKEGRHYYDFEINKEFFDQFEDSDVKEGALRAVIEADKSSSHVGFDIKITGVVRISCDRCLEEFLHPVDCENRLLVRFGKVHDKSDPEIITIPVGENELDLRQYFYEYILLALPIKRVHPDDKSGNSTCDPEMLNKLKEHIITEEKRTDPRWDDLKKLMKNN
jgi:uncharacterized protein